MNNTDATGITITVGFTQSDRANDYVPFDDGYRPGAQQETIQLVVTDYRGPALSLADWAEALFFASNAPGASPSDGLVVAAARAALVAARRDGARLRTLSIGDTVTIGDRTVACDKGVGWKPVTLAPATGQARTEIAVPATNATVAADVYVTARDAAVDAYRAVVAATADHDLQAAYDAALTAYAPYFANVAQAHAAVGAYVHAQETFARHARLVHGGSTDCACPA